MGTFFTGVFRDAILKIPLRR